MKPSGFGSGEAGSSAAHSAADHDLLSALAGTQGNRASALADRTCRVVNASIGVMRDQQAGRRRIRSVALAAILLVVLFLGPLVWWAVDNLVAGERLSDMTSQCAIWVCILCPALVACGLLAGWVRHRS